jgi:hypothetical protein
MLRHLITATLLAGTLTGTLTACLFDNDDSGERTLTLTGMLADLDTLATVVPDSGGPVYQVWFLPLDEGELDQADGANCFYTGYLGDSASTLYTNDLMAGEGVVEAIRSEGVELYRDTVEPGYTHYRVLFDCFD